MGSDKDLISHVKSSLNPRRPPLFHHSFHSERCFRLALVCRPPVPTPYKRDDDGGHSYLYKQPENDEETKLCEEALVGCPGEAIGRDGAE